MPFTQLRYAGTCVNCGGHVPARSQAWWDPAARTVTCAACASGPQQQNSARRFADGKQRAYEDRTRSSWGWLTPLVLALRPSDRDSRLAEQGAAGEERLTEALNALAAKNPDTVRVLHDRGIPGRRENIDHIVVTPAGIRVIDAKSYKGRIRVPWLSRDRLIIGRNDQAKLLEQSLRQQRFVHDALPQLQLPPLPVEGTLCFLSADFQMGSNGVVVDYNGGEVRICGQRRLIRDLRGEATGTGMTTEQLEWLTHRLATWFHPAR